jgi:hypothetical protein
VPKHQHPVPTKAMSRASETMSHDSHLAKLCRTMDSSPLIDCSPCHPWEAKGEGRLGLLGNRKVVCENVHEKAQAHPASMPGTTKHACVARHGCSCLCACGSRFVEKEEGPTLEL